MFIEQYLINKIIKYTEWGLNLIKKILTKIKFVIVLVWKERCTLVILE